MLYFKNAHDFELPRGLNRQVERYTDLTTGKSTPEAIKQADSTETRLDKLKASVKGGIKTREQLKVGSRVEHEVKAGDYLTKVIAEQFTGVYDGKAGRLALLSFAHMDKQGRAQTVDGKAGDVNFVEVGDTIIFDPEHPGKVMIKRREGSDFTDIDWIDIFPYPDGAEGSGPEGAEDAEDGDETEPEEPETGDEGAEGEGGGDEEEVEEVEEEPTEEEKEAETKKEEVGKKLEEAKAEVTVSIEKTNKIGEKETLEEIKELGKELEKDKEKLTTKITETEALVTRIREIDTGNSTERTKTALKDAEKTLEDLKKASKDFDEHLTRTVEVVVTQAEEAEAAKDEVVAQRDTAVTSKQTVETQVQAAKDAAEVAKSTVSSTDAETQKTAADNARDAAQTAQAAAQKAVEDAKTSLDKITAAHAASSKPAQAALEAAQTAYQEAQTANQGLLDQLTAADDAVTAATEIFDKLKKREAAEAKAESAASKAATAATATADALTTLKEAEENWEPETDYNVEVAPKRKAVSDEAEKAATALKEARDADAEAESQASKASLVRAELAYAKAMQTIAEMRAYYVDIEATRGENGMDEALNAANSDDFGTADTLKTEAEARYQKSADEMTGLSSDLQIAIDRFNAAKTENEKVMSAQALASTADQTEALQGKVAENTTEADDAIAALGELLAAAQTRLKDAQSDKESKTQSLQEKIDGSSTEMTPEEFESAKENAEVCLNEMKAKMSELESWKTTMEQRIEKPEFIDGEKEFNSTVKALVESIQSNRTSLTTEKNAAETAYNAAADKTQFQALYDAINNMDTEASNILTQSQAYDSVDKINADFGQRSLEAMQAAYPKLSKEEAKAKWDALSKDDKEASSWIVDRAKDTGLIYFGDDVKWAPQPGFDWASEGSRDFKVALKTTPDGDTDVPDETDPDAAGGDTGEEELSEEAKAELAAAYPRKENVEANQAAYDALDPALIAKEKWVQADYDSAEGILYYDSAADDWFPQPGLMWSFDSEGKELKIVKDEPEAPEPDVDEEGEVGGGEEEPPGPEAPPQGVPEEDEEDEGSEGNSTEAPPQFE